VHATRHNYEEKGATMRDTPAAPRCDARRQRNVCFRSREDGDMRRRERRGFSFQTLTRYNVKMTGAHG
jgi:ribosomal protein S6E (S10)